MSRENNSPSLFRVLAEETLVEYTAAAAVSGFIIIILFLILPMNEVPTILIAVSWSLLSLSLYLLYILPENYATYSLAIAFSTFLIISGIINRNAEITDSGLATLYSLGSILFILCARYVYKHRF